MITAIVLHLKDNCPMIKTANIPHRPDDFSMIISTTMPQLDINSLLMITYTKSSCNNTCRMIIPFTLPYFDYNFPMMLNATKTH